MRLYWDKEIDILGTNTPQRLSRLTLTSHDLELNYPNEWTRGLGARAVSTKDDLEIPRVLEESQPAPVMRFLRGSQRKTRSRRR